MSTPRMFNVLLISFLTTCFFDTYAFAGKDIFALKTTSLRGKPLALEQFKGKVLLVVNTASKCGFTGQYDGLEKIHKKYGKKGLAVIGFPSNDFGGQEPGSEEEIAKFCKFNYGVTFPMSKKVTVNGKGQHPIYRHLTTQASEKGPVSWNFEKFLVDRKGQVVGRFKSKVTPESKELTDAIEKLL